MIQLITKISFKKYLVRKHKHSVKILKILLIMHFQDYSYKYYHHIRVINFKRSLERNNDMIDRLPGSIDQDFVIGLEDHIIN